LINDCAAGRLLAGLDRRRSRAPHPESPRRRRPLCRSYLDL